MFNCDMWQHIILPYCTTGTIVTISYSSWIYKYLCNQCLSPLMLWVRILPRQGVLDTTLYDKVYVLLYYKSKWVQIWTNEVLSVTCDRSVVFSTNKTDRHDITEILLKVAFNHHYPEYLSMIDKLTLSLFVRSVPQTSEKEN
jgi:hypothetical protein